MSFRIRLALSVLLAGIVSLVPIVGSAQSGSVWLQWAMNSEHTSGAQVVGQNPDRNLFNIVYDPLVSQEQIGGGGDLLAHYQAPLVDAEGDVYMGFKSGSFDPSTTIFATETWAEKKLVFQNGQASVQWSFETDWKAPGSYRDFWEPVFHPVISGRWLYVPGAGGSIWKVKREDGNEARRIDPFGSSVDHTVFTISPLTADAEGNVFYNAVKLASANGGFYDADVVDSWLVKVEPRGRVTKVSYKTLVSDAPTGCLGTFAESQLPWPPAPNAVPPTVACGSVRVAVNSAPAIGPDGTIYNVARAHLNSRYAWIVAANPDLTPKWAASLRDRLHDGCNSPDGVIPPNGAPGGCRAGATTGVDPATNRPGGGRVSDSSSATLTVAPDGVLYGAENRYNYSEGHLMKFDFNGNFVGAFGFGWDSTAAIYLHGGSYSIIIKENHYNGLGAYCDDDGSGRFAQVCLADRNVATPSSPEQYFVTQLGPDLKPEWRFQNTNTESCTRNPDGSVSCVSDHANGFEWCVNAPVVDLAGVVYANSEDGNLFAIRQGGTLKQKIFQQLALGAAYTPMSIGPDGKLYSQNAGHLFVAGQ